MHTAHVKYADPTAPRTWYLVRLCASHNNYNFTDNIPLRQNAVLIPVSEVRGM